MRKGRKFEMMKNSLMHHIYIYTYMEREREREGAHNTGFIVRKYRKTFKI